jgi:hypothetical protein
VKDRIGYALFVAQQGGRHRCHENAIRIRRRGRDRNRRGLSDVLHAFQMKLKNWAQTPRSEMEMVKRRLREAERISLERSTEEGTA